MIRPIKDIEVALGFINKGASQSSLPRFWIPAFAGNSKLRGSLVICSIFFIIGCAAKTQEIKSEKKVASVPAKQAPGKTTTTPEETGEFPDTSFTVGPQTKLLVNVYDEPDLTQEVIVSNSGKIHYTFLGDILVQGLTLEQVEKKISKLLEAEYLVQPQVTITVKELGLVYVLGEVKNPGILKLTEQQTPLEAVAAQGGFREGSQRQLKVMRTVKGKQYSFKVSLKNIDEGGLEMIKTAYLLPGDTVLVE